MIIQGVFSMSILDRLRSIFGSGEDKEENDASNEENNSNNENESVKVTSSNKKLDDSIVSGTKTSEPISNVHAKSSTNDVPDEKDTKSSDKVASKKEATIPELKEEAREVAQERVDEVAEKETDNKESDLVDDSNVEEKKSDEDLEKVEDLLEKESEDDSTETKKDSEEVTIPELKEEAREVAQERVDEVAKEEAENDSDLVDDSTKEEEENSEDDLSKVEELLEEESESEEDSDENSETEESDEEVEEEDTINNNEKRDNMTLLTDKELLTMDSLDKDFTAAFIDAGIDTVKHCFQCGTCGGTCPSGRRTPYKVRQIVRKCLLGLKEEVISDDALWMCTTCYTCQERCPRSVIIVEIIKKARNIAAHAGYMAKAHKMTGLFVITTGHGVPINPVTKELRARVGLSELPPTTHMFPEALKEVQTICKATGFDELIGYDEETGELKPE